MKLADKTVVVTGAGSGIGRATALRFAREGAQIAACDVDQARLDRLAGELGDRALLVRKVDVSERAQMSAFADAVHAIVPAADVVVNNAGVGHSGAFLDTSLEDWDWLLGINLRGVVHGCHFFAPRMVQRRAGQVINLASILGILPSVNAALYGASKFAVLGFTQSLRAELEPHGVGVTAICPGLINTQIIADGRMTRAFSAHKATVLDVFKKGASPDLVAAAILDAAHRNPAVRTVGRDAWVARQLTRLIPQTIQRLNNRRLQRAASAAGT